jgi:hypothetical protein
MFLLLVCIISWGLSLIHFMYSLRQDYILITNPNKPIWCIIELREYNSPRIIKAKLNEYIKWMSESPQEIIQTNSKHINYEK